MDRFVLILFAAHVLVVYAVIGFGESTTRAILVVAQGASVVQLFLLIVAAESEDEQTTGNVITLDGHSISFSGEGAVVAASRVTITAAGILFHIQTTGDEDILIFAPSTAYQSVAFSTADLAYGESYQVYLGGTASGEAEDGR